MSNFDEKLSRMEFLMGYRMPVNESRQSNVEYHTEGADGKVYGILKEGTTYYIKTTEKGKETLAESYEYIGGFNYRNKNGFKSYNQASKILEQKMLALNESYGIHKDVSSVDFSRSEKMLETLTEAARKELDRVKMIMENSNGIKDNIGNHGNPESKGTSTGAQTEKNNKPFEDKTQAQLDRDDVKSESDPKKANSDYTDASKSVEKQMASDKAPTANDENSQEDYEKAKSDLDGKSVADQEPKGGKAVMVNEGLLDNEDGIIDTPAEMADLDEPVGDITPNDFGVAPEQPVEDNSLVGMGDEEEEDEFGDFDALMEEFKERISGDDETLTGPHGTSEVLTVDEAAAATQEPKSEEKQEALDGPKGSGQAIAMERLSEEDEKRIATIAEAVVNALFSKNAINEEKQEFGDHPKYGEQPMTTPQNTEVMKGTADRDFNDDSTKGDEQYGKKIGDGKPFDKAVEILTDSVMEIIKESLGLKKK